MSDLKPRNSGIEFMAPHKRIERLRIEINKLNRRLKERHITAADVPEAVRNQIAAEALEDLADVFDPSERVSSGKEDAIKVAHYFRDELRDRAAKLRGGE